jgi:hypothetical protein
MSLICSSKTFALRLTKRKRSYLQLHVVDVDLFQVSLRGVVGTGLINAETTRAYLYAIPVPADYHSIESAVPTEAYSSRPEAASRSFLGAVHFLDRDREHRSVLTDLH